MIMKKKEDAEEQQAALFQYQESAIAGLEFLGRKLIFSQTTIKDATQEQQQQQ